MNRDEHSRELAVSLAGHDKGRVYLVLGREGGRLLLTDGRYHPLERPKKKKEKHLQLIRHLPEEIREAAGQIREDGDVARLLRQYASRIRRKEETRLTPPEKTPGGWVNEKETEKQEACTCQSQT